MIPRGSHHLPFAFLTLFALLTAVAASQQSPVSSYRQGERRSLEPGIAHIQAQWLESGALRRLDVIELDLRPFIPAHATLAVAPEGGWQPVSLNELARATNALSALTLEPPSPPLQLLPLSGLLFHEGTLTHWPAAPERPVLLLPAEGGAQIVNLDEKPPEARIVLSEDQAPVPLAALNALPTTATAVVLLTGAVRGGDLAPLWPKETQALPLIPLQQQAHGGPRALWDGTLAPERRAFRPRAMEPLERLTLRAGEHALLLPPGLEDGTRQALVEARTLRVEVTLPRRVALSRGTAQGNWEWVLRDGKVLTDPFPSLASQEAPPPMGFLAVDAEGRRAWMGATGGERGSLPLPLSEAVTDLRGRGAWNGVAWRMPSESPLLPNATDQRLAAERGRARARLALVAVPRPAEGVLAQNADGAGIPLEVASYDASNARAARNGPGALFDGIAERTPAMDTFWAAEGTAQEPAWAAWRFPASRTVLAVDVIHAQTAGFSPSFNLAAFRLLGRERADRPWRELARSVHKEPVERERLLLDSPARVTEMRLEALEPNFMSGSPTVRVAEITCYGVE